MKYYVCVVSIKKIIILIFNARFCINVYEIQSGSLTLSRTLNLPDDISNAKPTGINFIRDSSGLVCRCQFPDLYVVIYYFDKKNTIIWNRICRLEKDRPEISCILACNLKDVSLYAVSGKLIGPRTLEIYTI